MILMILITQVTVSFGDDESHDDLMTEVMVKSWSRVSFPSGFFHLSVRYFRTGGTNQLVCMAMTHPVWDNVPACDQTGHN